MFSFTRPRTQSQGLLGRRLRALGLAVALCGLATGADAQWESFDPGSPNATRLAAAANLIIERWPEAVRHYERLAQEDPQDPWVGLALTRSLLRSGQLERAFEQGEKALEMPAVRAAAALDLARCAMRMEERDLALALLEEASSAELVMSEKALRQDEDLKPLRDTRELRALLDEAGNVMKRFEELADAEKDNGLENLWRANAIEYWEDVPSNLWVFKEAIDAYGKATQEGDQKGAARMARRLERGARAADAAFAIDVYGSWVERATSWAKDECELDAKLWKRYMALDGSIRSHRFANVLKELDELETLAKRLGDIAAQYGVDRTRGLVHAAILNYGPARKGISREDEYAAGRAAFERYLGLARLLHDAEAIVDSYDFLATFETQVPKLSPPEAEQLVYQGIIATARLEPSARELGMFEGIWRQLQEAQPR